MGALPQHGQDVGPGGTSGSANTRARFSHNLVATPAWKRVFPQEGCSVRRILAIDGGGIKGVFPASFLASIEDAIGDRVANYFDLIVGTSTGGIIALGLGLGMSAADILQFYE